jgi:hypothetical protein
VAAFHEREPKSAGMKIQKTSVQGDNPDKGTVAHIMYAIMT